MNFTIGRIGLDADIDDVSQWDSSGETVSLAFSTPSVGEGGSLERSNAYRQMFLGYAESADQKFVPVTWADDPTADGYYRVRSASVTPDPDLALEGLYYFAAELERVQGFGMPAIETRYLWYGRTNIWGLSGSPRLGLPNASRWDYVHQAESGAYSNPVAQFYPSSQEGGLRVVDAGQTGGSGPAAGKLASWIRQVDPADYYTGAARLEVNGYPVEGRQVPRDGWESWRIGNGMIRMYLSPSASGEAKLVLQAWNPSGAGAWSNDLDLRIVGDGSSSAPRSLMTDPESITILKNTAEEVVVRLVVRVVGRNWPVFLDVGIRRGMRFFVCRLRRIAGTGSAYPGLWVPNFSTDWGWRDGAYVDAGTINMRSFAWNPRCLVDAAYWDIYNAVGTATGRQTGTNLPGLSVGTWFRATASAAHATTGFGVAHGDTATSTPNTGLAASTQYTFAMWVRCSIARSLRLSVVWRTSGGTLISVSNSPDFAVAANTWTQVVYTVTSPATTARASVRVTGNSGGLSWTAGDTLDGTALQIEAAASVVTPYRDGSSAWSETNAYAYTDSGAPDAGSLRYSRSGAPAAFIASPVAVTVGAEAFDPFDVSADPASWDFGLGLVTAGVTGDTAKNEDDINAYFATFSLSDDVVAV